MKTIVAPMIFVFIALIVSIVAHKKFLLKKPDYLLVISLIAGVLASLIYQIIGILILGYLGPFIVIAFFIGALVGTTLSFMIGLVFRSINKEKSSQAT